VFAVVKSVAVAKRKDAVLKHVKRFNSQNFDMLLKPCILKLTKSKKG
jgi:hypothetical protein